MTTQAPPDSQVVAAGAGAVERRPLRVVITAKKRAWCGELYTTSIGANGLASRGHDVTVVHNIGSSVVQHIDRDAVRVIEMDFRRGVRHWITYFRTVGRLRTLVREHSIDIVENHASWDHWLSAVALSTMTDAPALVRFRHNRKAIVQHAPNRWLYRKGTTLFASQTERVQNDILAAGYVGPEKTRIVGSAMDLRRFKPDAESRERVRRVLGIGPETRVIGYVGRLSERKRTSRLVEIHQRVRAQRPDTRLVVVGWGEKPFMDAMEEAAKNDPTILYLGRRKDPESYYPAFDAFVLASHAESFPRAALESMACGVPSITGPDSGLRGFVEDGVAGRVLAADDVNTFAEAVADVFARPEFAAQIAAKGRALVNTELTQDAYVDRLETLLYEAVTLRPTR